MRALSFAKRNFKELIRDPVALIFEIVLPLFLLYIFQQINIPSDNYRLENFTPSITVFGLSFITLFTATLVSKDRSSALLMRLSASPMKPRDYILGYLLSLLPIILLQNLLFFLIACLMGLPLTINVLLAVFVALTISILFISIGILIGSLVSEKATGGIGSIVVQFVCFTSGMYFSADMVGATFAKICEFLPFETCVKIMNGVLNNNLGLIEPRNVAVFSIYTIIIAMLSSIIFKKKLKQ